MRLKSCAALCILAISGLAMSGVDAPALAHPAIPPAKARPLANLGPVGNGRRLFVELNCYQCHGTDGSGGGRAPAINEGGISYDQVYNVVERGEPYGGMPPFGQFVNTQNIDDLYAYIANFPSGNNPTWLEWWVNYPKY